MNINHTDRSLDLSSARNLDLIAGFDIEPKRAPKVDRKILTEQQKQARREEIRGNAAKAALTGNASIGIRKNTFEGRNPTLGETAKGAVTGAAVSAAASTARDAYDTATGNTRRNTGKYAPDFRDPGVRKEFVRREKADGIKASGHLAMNSVDNEAGSYQANRAAIQAERDRQKKT